MKPNWLTIRNEAESAEILIQGAIGASPWDESGVSEKEFTNALKSIPEGRQITVGINSQGGSIQDGLGIYNALRRRGDAVTVRVDGYAVSIASVIALAGAKRISPKSSVWMIHEPAMLAFGNAEDMDRARLALEAHAEVITDIYAERTSLTKDDARAKMKAETWFRGEEAVEMGFATEANDASVALNSLDATKFKTIPDFIKAQLTGPQQGTALASEPIQQPVACAPEISADTVASGRSLPAEGSTNTKGTNMETTPAANPPATNQVDLTALLGAVNALSAKVDGMKPAEALPPAAAPVAASRVEVVSEGLNDHLRNKFGAIEDNATRAKRYEYMIANWNQLQHSFPVNANTDSASGALTVNVLSDGFITVANNRLAPLSIYTRNFSSGRTGRNKIEVPKVTAGGTAQSNPTSFEDATNFVASVTNCEITPAHIVAGGHITNAELQNGWRMDWWIKKKVGELSDKIQAAINAVIVTGTYTADPIVASSSTFGADELKQCWAAIKNSQMKSILLDGSYYANFLPANLESFNPLTGNSYPGWDNFYMNNYWTGATANTVAFACGPDALLIGASLPVTQPNEARAVTRNTMLLPDLGLSVDMCDWFATSGRISWMTFELMFGAIAGDSTQGVLVKSS